jgi:hypothetical protein
MRGLEVQQLLNCRAPIQSLIRCEDVLASEAAFGSPSKRRVDKMGRRKAEVHLVK